MKKSIILLLTGLLMTFMLQAQDPVTLTNSSVLKMSGAKLSDELIIDLIKSSSVKFDLSDNALKSLASEGVSQPVIRAMKDKSAGTLMAEETVSSDTGKKAGAAVAATGQAAASKQPAPQPVAAPQVVTVEALNYVGPLTELIKFNENEFRSLETVITEWDKNLRGYIAEIEKVKAQILQMENDLRKMKNADAMAFTPEIKSLNEKLSAYRNKYQQSKEMILGEGESIVKQLETLKSGRIRDMGKAYTDVGQLVGSANTDPSTGVTPVKLEYMKTAVNDKTVGYIVFVTEMLAWYQNNIKAINTTINDWNPRVRSVIDEDTKLLNQLTPLERKLEELKVNSKANKDEISSLKKQVSEIEKARKQLAGRMKDDAKELVSYLKLNSQQNQDCLKERFTDIIDNTTYSFVEKLSL